MNSRLPIHKRLTTGTCIKTGPFQGTVGSMDVRGMTTVARRGKSFAEIIADETIRGIRIGEHERFGSLMRPDEQRPWKGAFRIVPEDAVEVWIEMLMANGLRRFSNIITIDWFTKHYPDLPRNGVSLFPMPVGCELLFHYPKKQGGLSKVSFRMGIIDPQFLNADGSPRHQELPDDYMVAVLNNMNPAAISQIYADELPGLLSRSGKNAKGFGSLIRYVAGQWGFQTGRQHENESLMRELVSFAMIHEFVHALILHLPDQPEEDMPIEARERLQCINFDKYAELLMNDKKLQVSVCFLKNLIKGLRHVKGSDTDEDSVDIINKNISIEMFCDRFSMYLYENFAKTQAYKAIFRDYGYRVPATVDFMLYTEQERRAGRLRQVPELRSLPDAAVQEIETQSLQAERDHIYVSTYGDPELTSGERTFFGTFLEYLARLDHENKIMRFSMRHAKSSRVVLDIITRRLKD